MPQAKSTDSFVQYLQAKTSIHYGYFIIVAATIGKIFSAPGQSPCIGVVIESIEKAYHLSSTTVSTIYMASTVTSAICLPFTGPIIQQMGVQKAMGIIVCGLSFSCILLTLFVNPISLYIAFFGLRFFGQGLIMSTSIMTINLWWVKQRGRMMGVAGAITSGFMLGVVPLIMMALIDNLNWRTCYFWLACATFCFMFPVGTLFYRDKPENIGLFPDAKWDFSLDENQLEEDNFTQDKKNEDEDEIECGELDIRQILLSPTFIFFSLADFATAATNTALFFHMSMIFSTESPSTIQNIYPVMASLGIVGKLVGGYLSDRMGAKFVSVEGLTLMCLGFASIPWVAEKNLSVFLPIFLIGVGGAFTHTCRSIVYAIFFGRANQPKIQPIATSITVLGSAFGPLPFSIVFDSTNSYNFACYAAAVVLGVSGILVWLFCKKKNLRTTEKIELKPMNTI
ncbi:hypothetical protein ScalyP_jg9698 [Parmales sp. scaly parma]|nr:hypothetical protein ScalyP_jg9698 [Parmales sp. scaly parma]